MSTRRVYVGPVAIGGGAPITVQTMTNTDSRDVAATLAQIRAMAAAGADIVRVSVYDDACAEAVRALVDGSPVPLVADIHFDHRLAIRSVENGIAKVRINPGNIGGEAHVRELADCLKAHRVPVRIGVNSGSIEKDMAWMPPREKGKLVIKKEFTNYYLLTFAFGIQKRIRMVFALWMFTQLLEKKADFTAILLIASAVVGIFVSPQMGKLLDRMGQKKAVMFEGAYMLVIFTIYGFVAKGFAEGSLLLTNMVLYFSIGLFVLADLTKFFEFFHNFAMRKMATDEKDISPTLSVGQAIDHVMAITLSPLFGTMWAHFGPQSVFWTCAAFSVVQFLIAPRLPESDPAKAAQKA